MDVNSDAFMFESIGKRATELLENGETDVYRKLILEMERDFLPAVMEHCRWNQLRAAQALGLSRMTLRSKIKALGLQNPAHAAAKPTEQVALQDSLHS